MLDPATVAVLRDAAAPIVLLSGAGISQESGLATFRDPDGIWARHAIDEVATPEAFARNPALVHRFYNARRRQLADPAVRPNPAHYALVDLERTWPGPVLLITQNVDDLHDRAGTSALIHMHGELAKARCCRCDDIVGWSGDLDGDTVCRACGRRGGMRPHVVWFGEMPLEMERIEAALARCGLFVAIGTSGQVYPAAGFAAIAREAAGAICVEVNLAATGGRFDRVIEGPAARTVPALVAALCPRR